MCVLCVLSVALLWLVMCVSDSKICAPPGRGCTPGMPRPMPLRIRRHARVSWPTWFILKNPIGFFETLGITPDKGPTGFVFFFATCGQRGWEGWVAAARTCVGLRSHVTGLACRAAKHVHVRMNFLCTSYSIAAAVFPTSAAQLAMAAAFKIAEYVFSCTDLEYYSSRRCRCHSVKPEGTRALIRNCGCSCKHASCNEASLKHLSPGPAYACTGGPMAALTIDSLCTSLSG